MCPMDRDISEVKQGLANIDCFDNTNVYAGLAGIAAVVEEAWGSSVPVNVILVTDGGIGQGQHSLAHPSRNVIDYNLNLPLSFKV